MCSILGFLIYLGVSSVRGFPFIWVIPSIIIIGIGSTLLYKLLPEVIKKIKMAEVEKKIVREKDILGRLENLRYEINSESYDR